MASRQSSKHHSITIGDKIQYVDEVISIGYKKAKKKLLNAHPALSSATVSRSYLETIMATANVAKAHLKTLSATDQATFLSQYRINKSVYNLYPNLFSAVKVKAPRYGQRSNKQLNASEDHSVKVVAYPSPAPSAQQYQLFSAPADDFKQTAQRLSKALDEKESLPDSAKNVLFFVGIWAAVLATLFGLQYLFPIQ